MSMFIRHVLVATDLSHRAEAALRYAVGLARALSAGLDLLHVVPAPPRSERVIDASLDRGPPVLSDELVREIKRKLTSVLARIPHDGVRVTLLVEPGEPAATIARVAAELPSDLVVLATHARTGLAEMVLGSVAHRVVVSSPCPVVTLRGDEAGAQASG